MSRILTFVADALLYVAVFFGSVLVVSLIAPYLPEWMR